MRLHEADDINDLVKAAIGGDLQALALMKEVCLQPLASAIADEAIAREWLEAFRPDLKQTLGFKLQSGIDFLDWAIGRVRAYKARPFRAEIRRFYAGDEYALNLIYQDMQDQIKRSAMRHCYQMSYDCVEDLCGEVTGRFVERRYDLARRYQPERGDFQAWAYYQIRDIRKRNATKFRENNVNRRAEMAVEPAVAAAAYDHAVESQIAAAEEAVIEAMDDATGVMYFLFFKERQPLAEVAGHFGLSIGYASKRLAVARARVDAALLERGYDFLDPEIIYTKNGKPKQQWVNAFFIHVVAIPLFKVIEGDPDWDAALGRALGLGRYLTMQRALQIKPNMVERAARAILGLYSEIIKINPDHIFCRRAREWAKEEIGKPIAGLLEQALL